MSTKIYYAWRCEVSHLPKAITFLRSRMWRRVLKFAETMTGPDPQSAARTCNVLVGCCGFHVFVDGTHAYFIAYGSHGMCSIGERLPKWIDEYGYWNNTDRPVHVTEKQWIERERDWDRVAFRKKSQLWSEAKLLLPVIEVDAYPFELSDFFRRRDEIAATKKA